MERIIRKILNYDVAHASNSERDEITASISALSMFLLDKTNYFDVPAEFSVESDSMEGGVYGDGVMKVSHGIFQNPISHAFANDIAIVAHEVCHYAQENCKDVTQNIISGKSMNYLPDRFDSMFFFMVQFFKPELFNTLQMVGPKFVAEMDEDLKIMYDYFYSFYELQPYEVEANNFSIEVLKYIVKVADKMELSDKEKRNLEELKRSMPYIKTYAEKIERYKKLRQDPQIVRTVRFVSKKVIEAFLARTDFANSLNKTGVDLEKDSVLGTVVDVSCQFLELNYDDDYAKKIMKMLLRAKPSDVRDRFIFQIGFWTEFKFTEEQEKQVKEILSKTNININLLTYDQIMAEKNRVISEREDLMRKRNKPVRTFNFD